MVCVLIRTYQGTLWVADIDELVEIDLESGNILSKIPTPGFIYFSYLEANTDGVDHLRLLGDNTWGFEDLAFGGDRDFNDFIVQAEFSLIF